jgi:hypothetical protein
MLGEKTERMCDIISYVTVNLICLMESMSLTREQTWPYFEKNTLRTRDVTLMKGKINPVCEEEKYVQ